MKLKNDRTHKKVENLPANRELQKVTRAHETWRK